METINGTTITTTYAYDDDQRVSVISINGASLTNNYDGYGRLNSQVTKQGSTTVLTDSYTYRSPGSGLTSTQVETLKLTAGGQTKTYTYQYDANGNITSINDGSKTTTYVYDSLNQLTRENNQAAGKTWVWTYDTGGNITSKKEYSYTTGTLGTALDTVSYTYGDSSWGDLLTACDGVTITHDGIGNCL